MSVDEIIDRERKGAFGFTDDRRCLFTYGDFRRLLMEIEAAWKREAKAIATENAVLPAVCITTKPIGNAAAMREAAETALSTIRGIISGTIARTNNSVFDCRDKLKSALAAPPRNCDKFTTLSDAWEAYCSSKTMSIFPFWLFDTNEEGGTE